MKRIISIVLSIVIVMGFAGCGKKEKTDGFNSLYGNKSSEDRLLFEKRSIEGNADLEVFWFAATARDDVKDAAAMYKDIYGGNIEYYFSSWNDRATDLSVLNTANQLPDVLLGFQETDFPSFIDAGFFGEIPEELFDFNSKYVEKLYVDSILKKDGKTYGIAIKDDPEVIIYNKDAITKLGYDTPYQMWKSGKWTWDALRDLAKKMSLDTDADGVIDHFGFNTWGFKSLFAANNTWPLKMVDGNRTLNITDSAVTETLQLVYDMRNVDKSFSPESREYFIEGKLAMYLERPQYIYTFINNGVDSDSIEIAPVPKGPSAKDNIAYSMPSISGIGNSCKNKEAALAFIECYISVQAEMSKTGPRESYGYTYSSQQQEVIDAIRNDYKAIEIVPTGYGNVNTYLNGIMSELAKGTTVAAAVEKYKTKMETDLSSK